jgi:hypothetical protein
MLEMTGFIEPTKVTHGSVATRYFGIEAVIRPTVSKRKRIRRESRKALLHAGYRGNGTAEGHWAASVTSDIESGSFFKGYEREEKDSHCEIGI